MSFRPLHSVGARLSLALLLVVAMALGIVYLVVIPSLEDRLVASKLSELAGAAPSVARQYDAHPYDPNVLDNAAASTNARVIVLLPLTDDTLVVSDNSPPGLETKAFESDPIAVRANTSGSLQRGTVTHGGERFAEAAAPDRNGEILLLSTSLEDSLADVDLAERRLLIAGLIALVVALAIGYGAAWLFARRIRRLERAADRITGGKFDEPVADEGRDELGELSRAFDRMRERLAQLDHARREFVANASHELRTPLFSLGGFLELLEDEDLDERTRREFMETMAEQVRRLTKLADDLLDLSRLDAGRLRVSPEPIDLSELAEAVVDEFAAVARASRHPLSVERDGGVQAVGDGERVVQIARILLENALVHTPIGTAVRVRTRQEDGRAVLEVEDEGPGIPPEHVQELFERFYRVDGTKASGSGLGLAIAKELAEVMGGAIEVESRRGRTTFALSLGAGDALDSVEA
jgi:signal transduction histidine kinase